VKILKIVHAKKHQLRIAIKDCIKTIAPKKEIQEKKYEITGILNGLDKLGSKYEGESKGSK
jgi:hypothetical protein